MTLLFIIRNGYIPIFKLNTLNLQKDQIKIILYYSYHYIIKYFIRYASSIKNKNICLFDIHLEGYHGDY